MRSFTFYTLRTVLFSVYNGSFLDRGALSQWVWEITPAPLWQRGEHASPLWDQLKRCKGSTTAFPFSLSLDGRGQG